MTDLKSAVAKAMADKRRELIAKPLASIWDELAEAAIAAYGKHFLQRYLEASQSSSDTVMSRFSDHELANWDASKEPAIISDPEGL